MLSEKIQVLKSIVSNMGIRLRKEVGDEQHLGRVIKRGVGTLDSVGQARGPN